MIGRIQDRNVSVPIEGKSNSQLCNPNESLIQANGKTPTPESFGVASVQDSFEKVNEKDLLQQIGLTGKSVIDPIGYPGEEWLWE